MNRSGNSATGILRRCLLSIALVSLSLDAQAYDAKLHQQLTFLGAKQFNNCVAELGLPLSPFTPLQVRYLARANVKQAQGNVFSRTFRWNYYNRANQKSNTWLWLVSTRFHDHFSELQQRLQKPRSEAARFRDLGRVAQYVQSVTSPARAVPVYIGRWWRFSTTDRFDEFAVDEAAVLREIEGRCEGLRNPSPAYDAILQGVAQRTLDAVEAPITGMSASWTAFWEPDRKAANFGEYGPAGNNFGRAVRFRCGNPQRCVLLDDDPLYADFARQRHVDAVMGTMKVLRLASEQLLPEPNASVQP